MKALSFTGVALAIGLVCAPAHADQQLAQKNACLSCHMVDKKLVGPAFREVAKKYAGNADALNQVAGNIRKGGFGKWGPVPMPEQTALADADARTLAAWILAGAK